jgi:hypothetical protein
MQTALNKLRPFAYAASERSGWIAESDDYAIPAERAVSSSCDQWKGCLTTVFRLRTWPSHGRADAAMHLRQGDVAVRA